MTNSASIRRRVPAGVGFGATAKFLAQYTTVQQTLKVARVATWNLQWQVKGFVSARPGVLPSTLLGRFVDGSGVEGIDLQASVVNTSWETLDQEMCRLLLTNTVALYESWCYDLCATFHHFNVITASKMRSYQDSLQWPDLYGVKPKPGIELTIAKLTSADDISRGMTALMSAIHPSAVDTSTFGPRLRVYRVFKEARNAIAHQGAIVNGQVCLAYNEAQSITAANLGMRVVPDFPTPSLGSQVCLSWHGIVGLADMLRRLVVDADHCLMFAKTAERDLAERLRSDPTALNDPSQGNVVIKSGKWAKLPGGPWIVLADHLRQGKGAVFHAIKRLLNTPSARNDDLMDLWPELLDDGAVEIRINLRGI